MSSFEFESLRPLNRAYFFLPPRHTSERRQPSVVLNPASWVAVSVRVHRQDVVRPGEIRSAHLVALQYEDKQRLGIFVDLLGFSEADA